MLSIAALIAIRNAGAVDGPPVAAAAGAAPPAAATAEAVASPGAARGPRAAASAPSAQPVLLVGSLRRADGQPCRRPTLWARQRGSGAVHRWQPTLAADGAFAVPLPPAIPPGTLVEVCAEALDCARSAWRSVEAEPPAQRLRIDLVLRRGATVRGRVLDPGGAAADGALVTVEAGAASTTARTDSTGCFELPLHAAEVGDAMVRLAAAHAEHGVSPPRVLSLAMLDAPVDDLVLTHAMPPVEVALSLLDGTPVEGLPVEFEPIARTPMAGFETADAVEQTTVRTDEDGRARARHLHPGGYRLDFSSVAAVNLQALVTAEWAADLTVRSGTPSSWQLPFGCVLPVIETEQRPRAPARLSVLVWSAGRAARAAERAWRDRAPLPADPDSQHLALAAAALHSVWLPLESFVVVQATAEGCAPARAAEWVTTRRPSWTAPLSLRAAPSPRRIQLLQRTADGAAVRGGLWRAVPVFGDAPGWDASDWRALDEQQCTAGLAPGEWHLQLWPGVRARHAARPYALWQTKLAVLAPGAPAAPQRVEITVQPVPRLWLELVHRAAARAGSERRVSLRVVLRGAGRPSQRAVLLRDPGDGSARPLEDPVVLRVGEPTTVELQGPLRAGAAVLEVHAWPRDRPGGARPPRLAPVHQTLRLEAGANVCRVELRER